MNNKFRSGLLSVLLVVAMLVMLFPVTVFAVDPDTTPPAFSAGYPKAGSPQMAGSRQVRVVIGAQEAAYYSFVLLQDGAASPTREQVAAGKDANGNPALSARNSGAAKYTSIDTGTYAPLHDTGYDIYVVLRDDAGNISEPAKVDVTTPPAADFFAFGYPKTGAAQAQGSKQVKVLVKIQNTQADGKVFYTLVPDGDPAPTIEQICGGKGGSGEPPVSSGSVTAAKGIECSFLVSGDADASGYDLYLVAGDAYYASPLSSCTGVVKMDITTPAAALPAVCTIGSTEYTSIGDALAVVQDGQTIHLLTNIDYSAGIAVDSKSVTFDLNGFTLNVNNPDVYAMDGAGLEVLNGGSVFMTGGGKLNVTGKHYGVLITSNNQTALATVTNATAISVDGEGVYAYGKSTLTVLGNATATGEMGIGACALEGADVTVKGNATGASIGAYALYASITVEGDAVGTGIPKEETNTGNGIGAYGGSAFVRGNVIANRSGAGAWGGGTVTVDGSIKAPQYIELESGIVGIDGYQAVTTKAGYRTYMYKNPETPETSTVWVRESLPVTYVLTVEDGSGDGSYAEGAQVSIKADAAPSGKVFDHWAAKSSGIFADAASAATTFTMPAAAVTVTAIYRDQDVPLPVRYTITASSENGGSISPGGTVSVNKGSSQSFSITPNAGYSISTVTVDGVGQGPISTYKFSGVTADHTITAAFCYTGGSGTDEDDGADKAAEAAIENPKTGDNSRDNMWWLICGIPISGTILQVIRKRRY